VRRRDGGFANDDVERRPSERMNPLAAND
jgi:hypothetical protein